MLSKLMKLVVAPLAVTIVAGLVVWFVQRERLSLTYEITASGEFPREDGIGRFFAVKLHNSGNKQVENINVSVRFTSGSIESAKVTEPNLIPDIRQTATELEGSIPLLNPGESLGLTVTVQGTTAVPDPSFVARAPGVTATPPDDSDTWPTTTLVSLVLVFAVVGVFATGKVLVDVSQGSGTASGDWLKEQKNRSQEHEARMAEHETRMAELARESETLEKQRREEDERRQKGEPRGAVLFFPILNRNGLGHRFIQAARNSPRIGDWQVPFLLLDWMLLGEEPRACIQALEEIFTRLSGFDPAAKGLGCFILSKMHERAGNKAKVVEWLRRCQDEAPLMYDHLMEYDPSIDLEQLSVQLRSITQRESR